MASLEPAVPHSPPSKGRRSLSSLFTRVRLAAALRRAAAVVNGDDPQAGRPADLLELAGRVRRRPAEVAEEVLALYDRRDPFGGAAATGPRWRLYRRALALWRATKSGSPLDAADDGAPVALLADYGGGCEVWRLGRVYLARYDVGAHVGCWREDRINRDEAEQALLGPEHFGLMIAGVQRRLKARGADLYTGSTRPLPPPAL